MPIPFIIGLIGAGLGVGAVTVVKECADEVIDDYVTELNVINHEMEAIQEKTNEQIKKTIKKFENAYTRLANQREEVADGTLRDFVETMSNLKNVDIELEKKTNKKFDEFGISNVHYKNNSYQKNYVAESILNLALVGILGIGPGGVVSYVAKAVKLQEKIDEAKVELARVKAASEEAKVKCTKISSLTTLGKNTYKTIDTLKNLTDMSIEEVSRIIKDSGTDYQTYTENEKDKVMIMYNFSFALMDLVFTDIFEENGEVSARFKKFVEQAKELI